MDVHSGKRRDRESLQEVTEAQVVSPPTKHFDSITYWEGGVDES